MNKNKKLSYNKNNKKKKDNKNRKIQISFNILMINNSRTNKFINNNKFYKIKLFKEIKNTIIQINIFQ